MFWNASTAIEGLSGSGSTRRRRFSRCRLCGLRLCRYAYLKRISPDRLSDVLELGRAEIGNRKIEPGFHLPIGVFGEADGSRLGYPFEPRGDIDAIAHKVAVTLFDHVA